MAPTQPYMTAEIRPTTCAHSETQSTVDLEQGPDPGGQLQSPASWEEDYEQMRQDEYMAVCAAVEDGEMEQIL